MSYDPNESKKTSDILPALPDPEEEFDAKREMFDWAEALVTSLVFIVLLFALVVRITGVDGFSMVPTLQNEERMLVSHLFYTPAQGDIVVVTKKTFMDKPIVKRIVAVGGQTVSIDAVTHEVMVDGVVLDEPYINEPTSVQGDWEYPVTVPEGCIFVMGDNRNKSTDSRFNSPGIIDEREILGRLILRIYPFSRFGVVE